MTWTLVTSGNASIFSLLKVKTPKIANATVADQREARRWTANIDELVRARGGRRADRAPPPICTRRARRGESKITYLRALATQD